MKTKRQTQEHRIKILEKVVSMMWLKVKELEKPLEPTTK